VLTVVQQMYTVGHKNVPLYFGLQLSCFLANFNNLVPFEAGMNTLQSTYVVFLNRLVTS